MALSQVAVSAPSSNTSLLLWRGRESNSWVCFLSPLSIQQQRRSSSSSLSLHVNKEPFSSRRCRVRACLAVPPSGSSSSSSSPGNSSNPTTKLYVSGLSFRTTKEGLTNAFQKFGRLTEVNLVMDKIANRPRGFAFLRYATEEESQRAIEGMHGKFLDGRVIFVEVARPRSEVRGSKSNPTNI